MCINIAALRKPVKKHHNKQVEGLEVRKASPLRRGSVKIGYTSIRSLNANKVALEAYIKNEEPQVIVLTETWLKPGDPKISLAYDYYNMFETKRERVGRRWHSCPCR